MKLLMVGCHEAGWNAIKLLLEKGIKFAYFITISAELANRNHVSGYRDFTDLAVKYNIPIYYAEKYSLTGEGDIAFFEDKSFDLLIQGGWQRLFPKFILDKLKIGAIGGHGSADFLPKGRGRSPINWSLIENKKRFIMHFFLMKPDIDDGDVFYFEMFDINEWDDCETLYYKISIVTYKVLEKIINHNLLDNVNHVPQIGSPTYYSKRTEKDGEIDWSKDVFTIYNLIRAVTKPYPGAYSFCSGEKVKIWRAQPFDTRIDYPSGEYGQIIYVFNKDLVVKCHSGLLLIKEYESNKELLLGHILQQHI